MFHNKKPAIFIFLLALCGIAFYSISPAFHKGTSHFLASIIAAAIFLFLLIGYMFGNKITGEENAK